MQSDFAHGRLSPEGFVELPPVSSGSRRSPDLSDRMEKLVGKSVRRTEATPSSVQALLERCGADGVTYLIPTEQERPWSPPVGYQCMYEAYFGVDTKLWFPIPHLITLYVSRRQVALSQFVNSSYRIVVALMVLSAEVNISLNVWAFEELTLVKALKWGLFAIRMRPNYNIITDHPNKTQKWKKNYFYVKADKFVFHEPLGDEFPVSWADHPKTLDYPEGFFDSACAIACLSHSRWPDIIEDRVRRALERISREDWDSRVPVLKKDGGKRLALFTNRQQARLKKARKMENIIDLNDLIDDELDSHQANSMSILDDMDLGGSFAGDPQVGVSAREEKTPIVGVAGAKKKGIKRPDWSGDDTGPSDEPQKKKKKKKSAEMAQSAVHIISPDESASSSRDMGASVEGGGSPVLSIGQGGQIGDLAVGTSVHQDEDLQAPDEPPLPEGPPIDRVEFLHPGNSLLVKDRGRCDELVWQIKGEPFDFPAIGELTFGDLYEKAARDQLIGIGSSNLLIAKYEKELKNTFVQLGRAQEVAQEKDRSLAHKGEELEAAKRALRKTESRAAKRKKKMKAKIFMLGLELEAARRSNEELKEKNTEVEREKAKLDQEKAAMLLKAAEEASRSRESQRFLVEKEKERVEAAMIEKCDRRFANIREYQVRRQAYDDKCLLYAQAFGTRKCLQKLLTRNQPLTQSTVAFFERKEQSLKAEADAQWIRGIPEADLSLSPLVLSPQASPDVERSALNSKGLFVDQAGADATGNQAETDAARVQVSGVSRTGPEDPLE
ncbi:hypothetical protein N665_0023s0002 [Sinapis alba]|nr:hypothetical protein N665_0023s0002 [Sinapis alba]